jgi:hypothetical protein
VIGEATKLKGECLVQVDKLMDVLGEAQDAEALVKAREFVFAARKVLLVEGHRRKLP